MDAPCYVFVATVVGSQDSWQGASFFERTAMDQRNVLCEVKAALESLKGSVFDVLTISRPKSVEEMVNLAKIVSKLSPLMGNLIEFKTTDFLNASGRFADAGKWKRQDPGFPDVILDGSMDPAPGLEIKAWFPLSTEITGRFKDSEDRFMNDEVDLAILAWLPECLFWGKPRIIDVCVVSGKSVARARDDHYHNPPHYIVVEPEDTAARPSNLQQSNTNGYVIQDSSIDCLKMANDIVRSWGRDATRYSTSKVYQSKLRDLQSKIKYRLDTNYAKIDRIGHSGIEEFKKRVLDTEIEGHSVRFWSRKISSFPDDLAHLFLEESLVAKLS